MVNLASLLKVNQLYSLLNVGGIYERDPNLFRGERPIRKMKWADYRELIGDWWSPERQIPFDPFASKLAEHNKMTVFFLDGKDIENFKLALSGREFKGTTID